MLSLAGLMSDSDSEVAPKRQKMSENELPSEDKKELQCAFWVERKKRFCKLTVHEGQKYCGEHRPVELKESGDNERIRCPLDGKHTVYRNKLHKHLKICNARPKTILPPYIKNGINAGDVLHGANDYNNLRISDIPKEELHSIIYKVTKFYNIYVDGTIRNVVVEGSQHLNNDIQGIEHGARANKHMLQIESLVAILEKENQLEAGTSFIEFGAGKGQFSLVLSDHLLKKGLTDAQFITVDRQALRHKKDNKIDPTSSHERVRVDIADLDLQGLNLLETTRRFVALSKHLCGSATDLTLRCVTQPATTPTACVVIALCCHHRCDWRSFVGKDFFANHNLSDRDFVIMTKMSSWAICGQMMSADDEMHSNDHLINLEDDLKNPSTEDVLINNRETIGLMCKRLLDYARLQYLKQHGYQTKLMYYVPCETTLENVCMVAYKTL